MKIKKKHIAIISAIMALFCLFGCSTPQRVYFFGYSYEDTDINATMTSAKITDKITINGDEITAPLDNAYLIVDMGITVKSGKWKLIPDFVAHKDCDQDKFSFDRDLTNQLTGFDVLKADNAKKQTIHLVFLIKSDDRPLNSYSLIIEYANGAWSGPFLMMEWKK